MLTLPARNIYFGINRLNMKKSVFLKGTSDGVKILCKQLVSTEAANRNYKITNIEKTVYCLTLESVIRNLKIRYACYADCPRRTGLFVIQEAVFILNSAVLCIHPTNHWCSIAVFWFNQCTHYFGVNSISQWRAIFIAYPFDRILLIE